MKQLLIRLKGVIKSKRLNVFLLFFSIAFFILIITKLSKLYTCTLQFNIQVVNVSPEIVLLNPDKKLSVTFKTDGFKWLYYVINTPSITLDFKKDNLIKEQNYIFRISDNQNKLKSYLPENAESIIYNKEKLVFKFDVNYTKIIPIKLQSELSFVNGYDILDSIIISPKKIKLIGPKKQLDSITFIPTEAFTLKGINIDKSFVVDLDLKQFSNQITSNINKVNVAFKVERFTEGTLKVPVKLINRPKGKSITYYPKTTLVKFYTSLKQFNSISEKDFKVLVDCNKINDQISYLMPQLIIDNLAIKSARINLKKVDYIITE